MVYQWLLILTTDYTSIQTKQRTLDDKASVAKTMCTTIVKAYQETPAERIGHAHHLHDMRSSLLLPIFNVNQSKSCNFCFVHFLFFPFSLTLYFYLLVYYLFSCYIYITIVSARDWRNKLLNK